MDTLSYYAGGSWILIMIPIVLMFLAQNLLRAAYAKYSRVPNEANLDGSQAARKILDKNSLSSVSIGKGQGFLSDYYDPIKKHINLSPEVYENHSIASVAIAAHESGHAIQHATGYPFIAARNIILPLAVPAGNLGWLAIIVGLVSSSLHSLIYFGIIALCIIALFQLLTLPIEVNASRRALKILKDEKLLQGEELDAAKKVLTAAALTYLVGLLTSIIEVMRAVLIAKSNSNNNAE